MLFTYRNLRRIIKAIRSLELHILLLAILNLYGPSFSTRAETPVQFFLVGGEHASTDRGRLHFVRKLLLAPLGSHQFIFFIVTHM